MAQAFAEQKRRKEVDGKFRKESAYRKHASASTYLVVTSIRKNINHLVKGAFSAFRGGVNRLASKKK